MPGYSCSIRERMLYSSCKNPLVDMVENKLQIEIAKKVRNYYNWLWHTDDILTLIANSSIITSVIGQSVTHLWLQEMMMWVCELKSRLHLLSSLSPSWRLIMGMNWTVISCMKRCIQSSMHTSRPLPSPKVPLGRGVAAASPDLPQKEKRKIKQTSALDHHLHPNHVPLWNNQSRHACLK